MWPTSTWARMPIYCTRTTCAPARSTRSNTASCTRDAVTTVSPTYAREITTPLYGMGMEQALAARGQAVRGILNGVDYEEWDPRHDRYLPIHFDAAGDRRRRRSSSAISCCARICGRRTGGCR